MRVENKKINMPYHEEEGYVARLVSQATENAITSKPRSHKAMPLLRIAAAVALIVIMGGSGWMYWQNKKAQEAPLNTFLSSITDEEAAMLENYYVEEIENVYIDELDYSL